MPLPAAIQQHFGETRNQTQVNATLRRWWRGFGASCVNCKWNYMESMSMSNEHSSDAKLISNTFMEQRSLALMLVACYSFRARTTYFSILFATSNSEFIIHPPNTLPLTGPLRFANTHISNESSLMEWFSSIISKCCFSLGVSRQIWNFPFLPLPVITLFAVFSPHREKLLIFIKLDGTKFVSRWNAQIEKYNFRACFDLI